ncbi:MAG: HAD-IA family hydrolase [Promethearchaeota archaeon]
MEIKTIIFDLGGVFFTNGSALAIDKMKDIYNITNVKLLKKLFSNEPGTPGYLIRLGKMSMDEFEEKVAEQLNLLGSEKKHIRHLWFGSYVPQYKMRELAIELRKKYRVILFSGNVLERIQYLDQKYDFLRLFDDAVFSYDYALNKDSDEFYDELLKHLDCNPNESLLIDDLTENIKQAQKFGINYIHYYYTEQLIEELKKYNINVNLL